MTVLPAPVPATMATPLMALVQLAVEVVDQLNLVRAELGGRLGHLEREGERKGAKEWGWVRWVG